MFRKLFFILLSLSFIFTNILWAEVLQEEELKAVFVYNFLKFIEWPQEIEDQKNQIILCIIGKTNLSEYLLSLEGQKIHEKTLIVKPKKDFLNLQKCHALFIGKLSKNRFKNLLSRTTNEPILTISDLPNFIYKGGIIELYEEDKKIRFKINLRSAHEAKLKISSRLLRLAKEVIK